MSEDKKSALITGVTGQDGSYLSELLLDKGYTVIGISRRSSTNNTDRLSHIISNPNFVFREGDVTDYVSISGLIKEFMPDKCYNLAAQSHVQTSFNEPLHTTDVNYIGVLNILEAIRRESPHTRFYQASTSEMFGSNYSVDGDGNKYQDENTAFHPRSPYAVAKLAAHYLVQNYREAYGIHASSNMIFNHESPRRGDKFVTRKITRWIANFRAQNYGHVTHFDDDYIYDRLGKIPKLRLGNLDAYRDWSHASDMVESMYLTLQQDTPDDYVVASGETHSVREFLDIAFEEIGIEDWSNYVVIDPKFFRPSEVDYLCGNPSKAKKVLGWKPSYSFEDLVKEMVSHDLSQTQAEIPRKTAIPQL